LRPNGLVELDIVLTIARLLWRKQNLASFETAKLVNSRVRQILEEEKKPRDPTFAQKGENHAPLEEAWRSAQTKARSELGDWDWDEFQDDDFGTSERLKKDLELEERLDAIIEKCVRRLLLVRGVKSMALAPPSEPPQIHKPRDVNRPAKDRVQRQAPPEAVATVQGQGPAIVVVGSVVWIGLVVWLWRDYRKEKRWCWPSRRPVVLICSNATPTAIGCCPYGSEA
jgi:hypothetical protein